MSEVYDDIKAHFENTDDVTVNSGRGAQGLKHDGKLFAMFYKGDLTLRFSPARTSALIESGEAEPYDPGTGKPMRDRVLIPAARRSSWIALTEESAQAARDGFA